ncbi:uncharacterized protein K441DRAFT_593237 [Cenococcum geophilum 1.58]|uniref:Uncharacterized protein n=1 Tax=Cenococcum geophilum 1.58 TaxID=794803 RepID=A0ACC8EMU4_9PEZI|nr:hypothetical protein K441DRAFT_593237 [Cenococcum geophilum 1.58]
MNGPLHLPPTGTAIQYEIVNTFWEVPVKTANLEKGYFSLNPYFMYYANQCRLAVNDEGGHILARTHRDICDIVQYIRVDLTREEIKRHLGKKLPDPKPANHNELLDSSIDLAVRLLVMMEVGELQYGFISRNRLDWPEGSLRDFLRDYFKKTTSGDYVRLERIFNARNLRRIAGIDIEWTSNIADHLLLIDGDTRVAIFHHAEFLKHQMESKTPLLPNGLAKETLMTIALLFPQSDISIKKWYCKIRRSYNLDQKAIQCGHLKADERRIENFQFWRERLTVLKQIFDEAEPKGISQWWHDRRKRVQWYTFWIAVVLLLLTVFFGFIQIIEGALQVYKAFHPLA